MFKLAVVPFDCLLVLRHDREETRRRHSFMTEIHAGAQIRMEGRDWIVVEIHDRLDDVPAVVCRSA